MTKTKRRELDKMADNAREWINTLWPILLGIGIIIIWCIRLEGSVNANAERSNNLNIQFSEFKNEGKESSKEQRKISDNVIEIKELLKSLDYKYVKRNEIDSRLLKKSYRGE
jgi:hypothetical protein